MVEGTIAAPITLRPEIVVLWDGTSLEDLGVRHLLTSATIGSTCERPSKGSRQVSNSTALKSVRGKGKRPKYYTRRKPMVSGAGLSFIVPDQAFATVFMQLIARTGRPTLSIGFRAPEMAGGQGIMIGSFKMDTIDWNYENRGFIKLELKGKTESYLGVASYKSPRNFRKKKLKSIIATIAEEHNLEVEYEDPSDPNLKLEFSVFSPSGETDYEFLDRILELGGFSGFTLADKDAGANLTNTSNSGQPDAGNSIVTVQTANAAKNATAKSKKSKGKKIGKLRISKTPTYLVNSFTNPVLPKVALAYGPGIVGQESLLPKDRVVLLISSMRVTMPQSGAAIPTTAKLNQNKKTHSIFSQVPQVTDKSGAVLSEGGVVRIDSDLSATGSLRSANTRKPSTKARASSFEDKNPQGALHRNPSLPKGQQIERIFMSSCPTSVSNDLTIAARNGARALQMGYVEELSVELAPGFPFINAPMEIPIFGTYVHDGTYGVNEVIHKFDSSGGLTTSLKLRRIKKKTKGKKRRSNNAAKDIVSQVPKVVDSSGNVLFEGGKVVIQAALNVLSAITGGQSASSKVDTSRKPKSPTELTKEN